MTDFETIARQKLSLAVDNSARRQIPYPLPWYERWATFAALVAAALFGAYCALLILFSLE